MSGKGKVEQMTSEKTGAGHESFLAQIEQQANEIKGSLPPKKPASKPAKDDPQGIDSRLVYDPELKAWLVPDVLRGFGNGRISDSKANEIEVYLVGNRWMTRQEIYTERALFFDPNKGETYEDYGEPWEQRKTPMLKPIPWACYEVGRVRKDADQLLEWRGAGERFMDRPEMRLVKVSSQADAVLRKALQKQAFLNASFSVLRQFQKFSPEEREELRQALVDRGITAWYQESERLDKELIERYPDPADRAEQLARASLIYRVGTSGGNLYEAGKAQERFMKRLKTKDAMSSYGYQGTAGIALKALAENNGNKTAAAKALGISRAKMRRLTGERM